jgi:hypothetical protein
MMSLITVVAASLVGATIAELRSTKFAQMAQEAFYDAEAGVRYAVNRINQDIQSGTYSLYNETNDYVTVSYAAPTGFNFDTITQLVHRGDNNWTFTVNGHCNNARSTIEITVSRPQLFKGIGIFGGDEVDLATHLGIYSYNSDETTNTTPANSTGQANIGSNGGVTVQPGSTVDGIFFMGEDEAGFYHVGPSGYDWTYVPHIDPDPLGARGGPLAEAFILYSNSNDNAAAGIVDNEIDVGSGDTFVLTGGNYYIEDLYMGPNSTLDINATSEDPAVIYLHGSMRIQPNLDIVVTNGKPNSFYIFSDSDDEIRLQPNSMFKAFVYAPYAPMQVQPNSELAGMFWGKSVYLLPGSDIYIDVSLLEDFMDAKVEIIQWRRL